MTSTESIAMRDAIAPIEGDQRTSDIEQNDSSLDQADTRHRESKRKRTCVIVGSAILQLPIWGRQNPL